MAPTPKYTSISFTMSVRNSSDIYTVKHLRYLEHVNIFESKCTEIGAGAMLRGYMVHKISIHISWTRCGWHAMMKHGSVLNGIYKRRAIRKFKYTPIKILLSDGEPGIWKTVRRGGIPWYTVWQDP